MTKEQIKKLEKLMAEEVLADKVEIKQNAKTKHYEFIVHEGDESLIIRTDKYFRIYGISTTQENYSFNYTVASLSFKFIEELAATMEINKLLK